MPRRRAKPVHDNAANAPTRQRVQRTDAPMHRPTNARTQPTDAPEDAEVVVELLALRVHDEVAHEEERAVERRDVEEEARARVVARAAIFERNDAVLRGRRRRGHLGAAVSAVALAPIEQVEERDDEHVDRDDGGEAVEHDAVLRPRARRAELPDHRTEQKGGGNSA